MKLLLDEMYAPTVAATALPIPRSRPATSGG